MYSVLMGYFGHFWNRQLFCLLRLFLNELNLNSTPQLKRIIDFKFENEMDEKEYVCAMYELLKTIILFSEQDLLPKVMNSENDAQPYS